MVIQASFFVQQLNRHCTFVKHKLDINANAEMIENIDNVIDKFKRVNIVDLSYRLENEQ